jgi:hypothetical protein
MNSELNTGSVNRSSLGRSAWKTTIAIALLLWLGASLAIDLAAMPALYLGGMMERADFAPVGWLLLGGVNRAGLVVAALVLAGAIALGYRHEMGRLGERLLVAIAALLLAIALVQTYWLTPIMAGLGASLSWVDPAPIALPVSMKLLHGGYFGLETLKLVLSASVLGLCGRNVAWRDRAV